MLIFRFIYLFILFLFIYFIFCYALLFVDIGFALVSSEPLERVWHVCIFFFLFISKRKEIFALYLDNQIQNKLQIGSNLTSHSKRILRHINLARVPDIRRRIISNCPIIILLYSNCGNPDMVRELLYMCYVQEISNRNYL